MKIAVASDDGQNISQHFGRAEHYVVLTIENGQITGRELREKFAHRHGPGHQHAEGQGRGMAPDLGRDAASNERFNQAAEDSHSRMAETITDCQIVLARGMGAPAYYALQRAGLQPMLVNEATVDEAAQAYIAGNLADHKERLH